MQPFNALFYKIKYHRVTTPDIIAFLYQLATLLSAGLPIVQCYHILSYSQKKPALRHALLAIKKELETGISLSQAMRLHPHYFDKTYCQLIQIGEQTGSLDIMLKKIVTNKEKMYKFSKKIKQALFYPAIITCVACITMLIMLVYAIPQFAQLFTELRTPIPTITAAIFSVSLFLRNYSWIILVLITFIIFIYVRYKDSVIKKILFYLPWSNLFFKKIALVSFLENLSLLLSAGIAIADALNLLIHTSHSPLTPVVKQLRLKVLSGESLHYAMQTQYYFPSMMLQLIKTGEESGTLVEMLTKTAYFYESEVDDFLLTLEQFLEPLIIIVLGALIGGLVIALYLPIFKLGTIM